MNAANQGGNNKPLMLQTHGSKFVQFQEVKIQEMASEVTCIAPCLPHQTHGTVYSNTRPCCKTSGAGYQRQARRLTLQCWKTNGPLQQPDALGDCRFPREQRPGR